MGCGSSVAVSSHDDITTAAITTTEQGEYGMAAHSCGIEPSRQRSDSHEYSAEPCGVKYQYAVSGSTQPPEAESPQITLQRTISSPISNVQYGYSGLSRNTIHRQQSWTSQPRLDSLPGTPSLGQTRIMITAATPTSLSPRSQSSCESISQYYVYDRTTIRVHDADEPDTGLDS